MKTKAYSRIGCFSILLSLAFSSYAQEPVHWDVVQKFMEEEFENSDAMENASWISDVFGARNSKTPSYIASANWVKERLQGYGLSNARLEPYMFGTGWANNYCSVHLMEPDYMPVIAYPAPWTSGTDGKIQAETMFINFEEITTETNLKQYKGKVRNKIIFTQPKRDIPPHYEPKASRFTNEQLDKTAEHPIGESDNETGYRRRSRQERLPRKQIVDYLASQGALAVVRTDRQYDYGTVDVSVDRYTMDNLLWELEGPLPLTDLVLAVEHYNRIMRIMEKDIPVEMEIEVRVDLIKGDPHDFNVVAEIPGTDLAHER